MIKNDLLTRQLYAQDASMYQEIPVGVCFPKSVKDIQNLVLQANQEQFSITARSAGTSLAGQTTGGGVIMDVSRFMDELQEVNSIGKYAKVQPGVIRDTLNREASKHKLLFGPDTATTNRCMIGGMIGNNSAGLFSIKYKTTREHVQEVEAVLSDGSVALFKTLSEQELEEKLKLDSFEGHIYRSMIELLKAHKNTILENYPHPEIIRRNTGYALDKLCEMKPINPGGRAFNLCELLCGSEGTLALTASAKLNLSVKPGFQRLVIPQFSTLQDAMLATVEAVKLNPSAVELVDDIILNATKGNLEQAENRFFLEGDPKCILIIQFEGDSEEELRKKSEELISILKTKSLGYTFPELSSRGEMEKVWNLRKAGLGLLMGLGKESRSPTFCEDTSVRVSDLPAYIGDFQKILERHNTECVYYAHASVGELHLRPMIDTTEQEGVTKMKEMATEIASLVRKYRGSLSGEHGDGRARAPFIEKVLGSEMMPILSQVKEVWDPNYIFNPGKIVSPKPMDEALRFSPDYKPANIETVFNWRSEGSFSNAIELCNGAGVCRKLAESGGTMCPSYMATKEEKDSTRGRGNVFRQVFSGEDPETFDSKELKDALDLCLSCKACKSECPANVDMAKMKAEFMHGWHQKHGVSLKERFFAEAARVYPLASRFHFLTNPFIHSGLGKKLLELVFGISSKRTLPLFAEKTFMEWFNEYSGKEGQKKVALFIDLFTNYHEPEIGKDAVKILEAMGFAVEVPGIHELGRPQLSKGLLESAKAIAEQSVTLLSEYSEKNIPVIGLEPSEILTLRDETLDLVDDNLFEKARKLAKNSFTFEEFISVHKDGLPSIVTSEKVVLHGHCHTKALTGNAATISALESLGYLVEVIDTGCCGMAGSFGYDKDKYELSMEIGEQRLFPEMRRKSPGTHACVSGFSCRHQVKDGTGMDSKHIAQLLARALSL